MNLTLAAAEALGVSYLKDWIGEAYFAAGTDQSSRLMAEIDRFRMMHVVSSSKQKKQFSVPLDEALRQKIRHFSGKIKELIQTAEIETDKKEALISKLASFELELERSRTSLQHFSAVFVSVCSTISKGVEQLKPALEPLEKISALLGERKAEEEEFETLQKHLNQRLIGYQRKIEDKTSEKDQPQ